MFNFLFRRRDSQAAEDLSEETLSTNTEQVYCTDIEEGRNRLWELVKKCEIEPNRFCHPATFAALFCSDPGLASIFLEQLIAGTPDAGKFLKKIFELFEMKVGVLGRFNKLVDAELQGRYLSIDQDIAKLSRHPEQFRANFASLMERYAEKPQLAVAALAGALEENHALLPVMAEQMPAQAMEGILSFCPPIPLQLIRDEFSGSIAGGLWMNAAKTLSSESWFVCRENEIDSETPMEETVVRMIVDGFEGVRNVEQFYRMDFILEETMNQIGERLGAYEFFDVLAYGPLHALRVVPKDKVPRFTKMFLEERVVNRRCELPDDLAAVVLTTDLEGNLVSLDQLLDLNCLDREAVHRLETLLKKSGVADPKAAIKTAEELDEYSPFHPEEIRILSQWVDDFERSSRSPDQEQSEDYFQHLLQKFGVVLSTTGFAPLLRIIERENDSSNVEIGLARKTEFIMYLTEGVRKGVMEHIDSAFSSQLSADELYGVIDLLNPSLADFKETLAGLRDLESGEGIVAALLVFGSPSFRKFIKDHKEEVFQILDREFETSLHEIDDPVGIEIVNCHMMNILPELGEYGYVLISNYPDFDWEPAGLIVTSYDINFSNPDSVDGELRLRPESRWYICDNRLTDNPDKDKRDELRKAVRSVESYLNWAYAEYCNGFGRKLEVPLRVRNAIEALAAVVPVASVFADIERATESQDRWILFESIFIGDQLLFRSNAANHLEEDELPPMFKLYRDKKKREEEEKGPPPEKGLGEIAYNKETARSIVNAILTVAGQLPQDQDALNTLYMADTSQSRKPSRGELAKLSMKISIEQYLKGGRSHYQESGFAPPLAGEMVENPKQFGRIKGNIPRVPYIITQIYDRYDPEYCTRLPSYSSRLDEIQSRTFGIHTELEITYDFSDISHPPENLKPYNAHLIVSDIENGEISERYGIGDSLPVAGRYSILDIRKSVPRELRHLLQPWSTWEQLPDRLKEYIEEARRKPSAAEAAIFLQRVLYDDIVFDNGTKYNPIYRQFLEDLPQPLVPYENSELQSAFAMSTGDELARGVCVQFDAIYRETLVHTGIPAARASGINIQKKVLTENHFHAFTPILLKDEEGEWGLFIGDAGRSEVMFEVSKREVQSVHSSMTDDTSFDLEITSDPYGPHSVTSWFFNEVLKDSKIDGEIDGISIDDSREALCFIYRAWDKDYSPEDRFNTSLGGIVTQAITFLSSELVTDKVNEALNNGVASQLSQTQKQLVERLVELGLEQQREAKASRAALLSATRSSSTTGTIPIEE